MKMRIEAVNTPEGGKVECKGPGGLAFAQALGRVAAARRIFGMRERSELPAMVYTVVHLALDEEDMPENDAKWLATAAEMLTKGIIDNKTVAIEAGGARRMRAVNPRRRLETVDNQQGETMKESFTQIGVAERRGFALGVAAARKLLEKVACRRFLGREEADAERARDLAFVVGQIVIPDDLGQVEPEPPEKPQQAAG